MDCHVSRERLWSWIDRDAPELEEHVASCVTCRRRTEVIRSKIRVIAAGSSVVLPEKVGPYTVRGLLGEGGQALVYEAVQPAPRRTVALKVLKGGRFASEKLVEHFRRESQALAELQHDGIATIFEAGCTEEGLHYFAMERVDGVPLDRFLRERNPGREGRLELFGRICEAVAFAHERGVVHRDLKPSNIIVDDEARPKILDFGLARMIRQDSGAGRSATRTGLLAGTPRYMSPEQARGSTASADPRSDVYSLGVILYEILTGRPPHDIRDLTPDSLRILLEEPPARPSRLDRTVPRELDAIVLKALDKDPARRYSSAAGLCEDLRRLRDSEPVLARPPSIPYRFRKRLYRHRRNAALAIAAAAVLAALGLVAYRAPFSSPPSFDLDSARAELLEIRRDLLRGDRGHTSASRATEIGRIYPGLPEVVLLRAQAICLTEGPQIAVPWLTVHASGPSAHWSFRVLLDEIRGDDPRTSANRLSNPGATDVDPDSAEGWYLRSFATLDVKRALERAAEAERRDPGFRPALATLALLSPLAGDVEGALAWSGKLERMDLRERASSRWSDYRIELLFGQERFEEALAECDRLVARGGPGSRGVIQRARVLRRMGRYEEAVRDLTRAIEARGPDTARSTWLYYHRGTLLWMLGRDREAIGDYSRVYRSLTYASYANVRLFFILQERGNASAADGMLAEARDRVSNDPWLAAILASLAGERTPEQLIAAASDPIERCEALYYAGEISLLRGRRHDAVRWFRECVATGIDRDPAEFWEPMSEFELARWRLERLDPSGRPTDPSAGS